ncbi:MAG: peptide deformylase [Candidatus Nealsonbacteria bacterium]|nr:peptide deformylase [Candidatus Nealsonbacteria bacterium]
MAIVLPKQLGTKEGDLLSKKSELVLDFKEADEIVKSLKESLNHYGGVGIAAPQIGISKRIFIVDIKPTERYKERYPEMQEVGFVSYINPKILKFSLGANKNPEGCLSVFYGAFYGKVKRANNLKIEYFDLEGKKHTEQIKDSFHARVIQHEFDHLEGKNFLYRMEEKDFLSVAFDEKLDIRKKD